MFETLVISGGSTKGFLAIGALHYIEHIKKLDSIKNFYGTSVGSMISLLIAVGYKPIDLVSMFQKTRFAVNPLLSKIDCQVIDYEGIMARFEGFFTEKAGRLLTLSEFYKRYKKNLFFITFNYSKGVMEVLSRFSFPEMQCTHAVKLSCAIPFLFKKCIYNSDLYVDGGFANNFPVDIAVKFKKENERILALKIDSEWTGSSKDNCLAVMENIFFAPIILKMKENAERFRDQCLLIDLVSNLNPFSFGIDVRVVVGMLNEGYEEAKNRLTADCTLEN